MFTIESLYHQYKQDVYGYLISLTHNPSLSEDLLSETFLKAIYALPSFRKQSSVKTWLFGIARNTWLQYLRKKKAHVSYDDLLGIYMAGNLEDEFFTKQAVALVYELLGTKDEKTQSIVRMRINGISYKEISEKLGVSEGAARVVDYRTKKWLKSKLNEEGLL